MVQLETNLPRRRRRAGVPEIPGELLPRCADVVALRLMLSGESAIDLPRLLLGDRQQVDSFIRLCGFDPDNPLDVGRIHALQDQAVAYLRDSLANRLASEVTDVEDIHDLFLLAGSGPRRLRRQACMMLKVLHIMHHIAGRALLFETPISEAQLLERLNRRVFNLIDHMRQAGIGVQEFSAGQKSLPSLVSKLLAKRSNLACHVFDRLRFRIVVRGRDDLVKTLLYLSHHLFPFNYVIPEQSKNSIIEPDDVARVLELPRALVDQYWGVVAQDDATGANEFSGRTYRSVSLVVDIPIRIDDVVPDQVPAIVFVQTEIQLLDAETQKTNNKGENSHRLYKQRQLARVRARLRGADHDPLAAAWQATKPRTNS